MEESQDFANPIPTQSSWFVFRSSFNEHAITRFMQVILDERDEEPIVGLQKTALTNTAVT